MRKFSVMLFLGGFAFAALLHFGANTAEARKQYLDEFKAKYVKADGTPDEKAFADTVKKTSCMVCHEGDNKKNRNAFGKELAALLKPEGSKGNEKDVQKIDEALEKVMAIHIDAKDPKSPTYGDLIKQGKLPVESKPADGAKAP